MGGGEEVQNFNNNNNNYKNVKKKKFSSLVSERPMTLSMKQAIVLSCFFLLTNTAITVCQTKCHGECNYFILYCSLLCL